MKLAHLRLCGFRGFRNTVDFDFDDGFTVIDGRNGVGKSTLCDAVEFALTGEISKYQEAKTDRESMVDYVWWRGDEPAVEYFVELGIRDPDGVVHRIRRSRGSVQAEGLAEIEKSLIDDRLAPREPLRQLCQTLIIRDEDIARLSLDLTESERFQFLRQALGSIEAEDEIRRAGSVHQLSKKRLDEAKQVVGDARRRINEATRRIDDARTALADDESLAAAASAINSTFGIEAPLEELASVARPAVSALRIRIERLERLRSLQGSIEADTQVMKEISAEQEQYEKRLANQQLVFTRAQDQFTAFGRPSAVDDMQETARLLSELAELGERLGLTDEQCPLCGARHTVHSFEQGIARARGRAQQLDAQFIEVAHERRDAEFAMASAGRHISEILESKVQLDEKADALSKRFEQRAAHAAALRVSATMSVAELDAEIGAQRKRVLDAEKHLAVLDTLSLSTVLASAIAEKRSAEREVEQAEGKLATARVVETRAKSLLDAAQRASGEILDRRLERIGPLLGELYRRLRPHPIWGDIDYKVRGDIRRFLKLEVGESLNPQFLFSSGQRRATGIAFLLSIFLSTSWRRLNTLILDDPVQHIDDFRAVHLAEVLAQLRAGGLQIVCAVEDPALADLLCRRMASAGPGQGRRITLGWSNEGNLSALRDEPVRPFIRMVLSSLDDASSKA